MNTQRRLSINGFHLQSEVEAEDGTTTAQIFVRSVRHGIYALSMSRGFPTDVLYTSANGVREEIWSEYVNESQPDDGLRALIITGLLTAAFDATNKHAPALSPPLDEALGEMRFLLPDEIPVEYVTSDATLLVRLGHTRNFEACNRFAASLRRIADQHMIWTSFDVSGQEDDTFPMARWLHRFGYRLAGLSGHPGQTRWSHRCPVFTRRPGDPTATEDLKPESYFAALKAYNALGDYLEVMGTLEDDKPKEALSDAEGCGAFKI